jgi:hypothetical protein
MNPKSGSRFSEKVVLEHKDRDRFRFDQKRIGPQPKRLPAAGGPSAERRSLFERYIP